MLYTHHGYKYKVLFLKSWVMVYKKKGAYSLDSTFFVLDLNGDLHAAQSLMVYALSIRVGDVEFSNVLFKRLEGMGYSINNMVKRTVAGYPVHDFKLMDTPDVVDNGVHIMYYMGTIVTSSGSMTCRWDKHGMCANHSRSDCFIDVSVLEQKGGW